MEDMVRYVVEVATALLQRCDGAVHKDGVGYNKVDTLIVRRMLGSGGLPSPVAAEHLRRLLFKYRRQIEELGFDYDRLVSNQITEITPGKVRDEARWLRVQNDLTTDDGALVHMVRIYGDWDSIMEAKELYKSRGYRWAPESKTWVRRYVVRTREDVEKVFDELRLLGVDEVSLDRVRHVVVPQPAAARVATDGEVATVEFLRLSGDDFSKFPPIVKKRGFKYQNGATKYWYYNKLHDIDFMIGLALELASAGLEVRAELDAVLPNTDDIQQLKAKYPHLYAFQARDVARALKAPGFGFFWEMGAGKTIAGLTLIAELGKPALVVAPVSVIPEWVRMNQEFGYNLPWQVIRGNRKDREAKWAQFGSFKLNLVSYETLRVDYARGVVPGDVEFVLVLDEATKIKNRKAKVSKVVHKLREQQNCVYCAALSGTPLENHLLDYFSIINAIKPAFISWREFASKYVVWGEQRTPYGWVKTVAGYKNLDGLKERIAPISSRVRKEDVLPDLPPKIWQYRFVEMSSEQYAAQSRLIAAARNQGKSFIGVYQLLRVLADGLEYLQDSDSEFVDVAGVRSTKVGVNPKKVELGMLLEQINGSQVVIFTSFERVALDLYSTLKDEGYSVQVITGATPHKRRAELVAEFNAKKYQVLVCDDVLAYGVNMPDVDYLINYDIHPNPAKMRQRADRIHRLNSKRAKTIISLIAGIEHDIYEILKEKSALFEQVVEKGEVDAKAVMKLLAEKYGFER